MRGIFVDTGCARATNGGSATAQIVLAMNSRRLI